LFIQRKLNWIQFNELSNWFHFLIEKKPTKNKKNHDISTFTTDTLSHPDHYITFDWKFVYVKCVRRSFTPSCKNCESQCKFCSWNTRWQDSCLYCTCYVYITTSLFVRICGHLVLFEIYREYVRSEYSLILTSVTLL